MKSFWAVMTVVVFVVGLQVGIKHGRQMEQKEFIPALQEGFTRLGQMERAMASLKRLDKVVACESSYRPTVWGDNGKSYGVAQYKKKTFDWLSKKSGINGDWKNPKDQVVLLNWAINNDLGYLWTCYEG